MRVPVQSSLEVEHRGVAEQHGVTEDEKVARDKSAGHSTEAELPQPEGKMMAVVPNAVVEVEVE